MKKRWLVSLGICFLLLSGSLSQAYGNTNLWEQIDTVEGVNLYRSLEESDELLPFKAIAELNIPHQQIVMALVNAEHKNRWAPKLKFATIYD